MFKIAETNNNINIYPNLSSTLSDNQQLMLNRINEIKDYFVAEIKERELMSKRLSKYVASFYYYSEKSLIALSVTTDSISIASFSAVIGAPLGIASGSFSLAFSISTRVIKKIIKSNKK